MAHWPCRNPVHGRSLCRELYQEVSLENEMMIKSFFSAQETSVPTNFIKFSSQQCGINSVTVQYSYFEQLFEVFQNLAHLSESYLKKIHCCLNFVTKQINTYASWPNLNCQNYVVAHPICSKTFSSPAIFPPAHPCRYLMTCPVPYVLLLLVQVEMTPAISYFLVIES